MSDGADVLQIKANVLAEARLAKASQREQFATLVKYHCELSPNLASELLHDIDPSLCGQFVSIPSAEPGYALFEFKVGPVLAKASDLFALSAKLKVGKLVQQRFDETWERLQEGVRDKRPTVFEQLDDRRREQKRQAGWTCRKWRTCVSNRSGNGHIARMVQNIDKAVKAFAKGFGNPPFEWPAVHVVHRAAAAPRPRPTPRTIRR